MIPDKVQYGFIAGTALGVVQVGLLRNYDNTLAEAFASSLATNASTPAPFLAGSMGNFGSPSVVIDLATGAVALGVAFYANRKGKFSDSVNGFLFGYGTATFVGGIMDGIFPNARWANMVAYLNGSSSPSSFSSLSIPKASAVLIKSGSTSGSGI